MDDMAYTYGNNGIPNPTPWSRPLNRQTGKNLSLQKFPLFSSAAYWPEEKRVEGEGIPHV